MVTRTRLSADFYTGASNAVDCTELKPGQRLLIVADDARSAMGKAYAAQANTKGLIVELAVIGSKEKPATKESPEWARLLQRTGEFKPDAAIALFDKESLPARGTLYKEVTAHGGFTFTSPRISYELVEQVLSGSNAEVQNRTAKVFSILDSVRERNGTLILVTRGSSYFCKLGKDSRFNADDARPPKSEFLPGMKIANLPGGEVETINAVVWGEIFFGPGSRFGEFGEVEAGIIATFKDSKLVKLIALSETDQGIVDKLNDYMAKRTNNVVEPLSIGTNNNIPKELNNTTLTREKVFGTAHIGVGDDVEHQDLIVVIKDLLVPGGPALFRNHAPTPLLMNLA